MNGEESSNVLKNLLVFVAMLAILGMIVAMVMYFTVDLPAMQAMLCAPTNAIPTPVNPQITDSVT